MSFHCSLLLACSLHFSSSSAFLRSVCTQSSHLSSDLPRFLQPSCFCVSDHFGNLSSFILTMCPAHFIRLLTILPTIQALVPTSSRRSFILLLSTLFTIFLIQLFSHTCSLCCCSLDIANVSKPYVLAGATHEYRTFPISFLEIFLSIITPSTFLHAFAPACILRRTSTRPFSDIFPPGYTKFFTCLMSFSSNLMFTSSLFPNSHPFCLVEVHL